MAVESNISDVLQAIGYSELIEKFEDEETNEDLASLLTDVERIKRLVPEAQRIEFTQKVVRFFADSVNDVESDFEDAGSDNRNSNENFDSNNIAPRHHSTEPIFVIENVDITEILSGTFEGRQILSWHKSKSFLTPGQRKRLVHQVIAGVMNICNRKLSCNDFKVLSRKIVEVFPKECALVYYVPRVSRNKSDSGKEQKPKGKLLNKYQGLQKLKIFDERRNVTESGTTEDGEFELTEQIEEIIEWLKYQEEPWEETQKHWKVTADYRKNQVETVLKNKICDLYQEWPILKSPKGYLLIAEDFLYRKFTERTDGIQDFKTFFDKALEAKPLRKDETTDLLKSMLEKEDLKEDNGTLVRLMLLCLIIPSTARIPIGNKKKWKPSAVESLEGIVTRIKIHGDIEQAKIDRRQHARSKRITVQPYVIVVEEDDYEVDSVYLCVDDILYEIPSLLAAIDLCFKSFHVFQAVYTPQSDHIWLLLQLGLYKFRTKWDQSNIDVTALLNDMGCLLPLDKSV